MLSRTNRTRRGGSLYAHYLRSSPTVKGFPHNSLTVSDYNTLGDVCQVFYIKFLQTFADNKIL
nr:MAG TPA: hypothetical protein [Siphoviridae sp. ctngg6]